MTQYNKPTNKPFTRKQLTIIFKIAFLEAMALSLILPSVVSTGEIPVLSPIAKFNGSFKQVATANGGHFNDIPQNHKEFFAMQNWWVFFVNTSGYIAYTVSPSGSGTWTVHNIPWPSGFTINEGTEYAVDNNATEVFVWMTPRSGGFNGQFLPGILSTNGNVNWNIQATTLVFTYSNTGPVTQYFPMNGVYPTEHIGNNIDAVGTCLLSGGIGGVVSGFLNSGTSTVGISMNGTGIMKAQVQVFLGATSHTDVVNNAFCHSTGVALATSNTVTLPDGGSLSTPQEIKFTFPNPSIFGTLDTANKNYTLVVEAVYRSGLPSYSVNFQATNCEFGSCGGSGFKSGLRWNGSTQTWDTAFSVADTDLWFNLYMNGNSGTTFNDVSSVGGNMDMSDAEIVYQSVTGKVYLFGTFPNNTNSTTWYWVSTDSSLVTFSTAQKLGPTLNNAVNDQLFSAVDLRDGTIYVMFYPFCNPNFSHSRGLLGKTLSGTTQGALESIPTPISTNYCEEQLYSISPGYIIGFFSATTNNSTFTVSNTWFNTRSSNGVWSSPTVINFYTGQLGISANLGGEWCTFPVQDAFGITYFVSGDPNNSNSFTINIWSYINYVFITKSNVLTIKAGNLFSFCPRQVINNGEFIWAVQNDTSSPNPVKIVDMSLI